MDAKWYAQWIRLLPAETAAEKMRNLEAADMMEQLEADRDAALAQVPQWISVEDEKPDPFVSVQVYMTDAGVFPPVREGYLIDDNHFFVPALGGCHPISHWKPFDEPPKEEESRDEGRADCL